MSEPGSGVPVTLLTGFLGAGKTTLLNRLLAAPAGRGTAVIVNEFGELPIDGRLVVAADDEVLELANGCICCTVRGDLVRTAKDLFERRARGRIDFRRLLIEASGLASPGPVHQTFRLDDTLRAATRPCGIAALCHAGFVLDQMERYREVAEQIAYADVLVLNHTDAVSAERLAEVRAALVGFAPTAAIHTTVRGAIDVERFLVDVEPQPRGWRLVAAPIGAVHTSGIASHCLVAERALDLHRLKIWLQFVAARRDWEVMRMKGVVRVGMGAGVVGGVIGGAGGMAGLGGSESESERESVGEWEGDGAGERERRRSEGCGRGWVVVQAVHQYLELGPAAEGQGGRDGRSVMVVIGRGIDERVLREGWARL